MPTLILVRSKLQSLAGTGVAQAERAACQPAVYGAPAVRLHQAARERRVEGGKAGYRDERGVDDCLSSRNGDPQCFAAMIRGGDAPITEKTWQPCEIGDNFVERRFDNSRESRRGTLGTLRTTGDPNDNDIDFDATLPPAAWLWAD